MHTQIKKYCELNGDRYFLWAILTRGDKTYLKLNSHLSDAKTIEIQDTDTLIIL